MASNNKFLCVYPPKSFSATVASHIITSVFEDKTDIECSCEPVTSDYLMNRYSHRHVILIGDYSIVFIAELLTKVTSLLLIGKSYGDDYVDRIRAHRGRMYHVQPSSWSHWMEEITTARPPGANVPFSLLRIRSDNTLASRTWEFFKGGFQPRLRSLPDGEVWIFKMTRETVSRRDAITAYLDQAEPETWVSLFTTENILEWPFIVPILRKTVFGHKNIAVGYLGVHCSMDVAMQAAKDHKFICLYRDDEIRSINIMSIRPDFQVNAFLELPNVKGVQFDNSQNHITIAQTIDWEW